MPDFCEECMLLPTSMASAPPHTSISGSTCLHTSLFSIVAFHAFDEHPELASAEKRCSDPLAGCFLALGSGLRLVGTVPSRR